MPLYEMNLYASSRRYGGGGEALAAIAQANSLSFRPGCASRGGPNLTALPIFDSRYPTLSLVSKVLSKCCIRWKAHLYFSCARAVSTRESPYPNR